MCDDKGTVYVVDWGLAAWKQMPNFNYHVLADYPEHRAGEKLTFDDLLNFQKRQLKRWDI
jgi:hypothetical protein